MNRIETLKRLGFDLNNGPQKIGDHLEFDALHVLHCDETRWKFILDMATASKAVNELSRLLKIVKL